MVTFTTLWHLINCCIIIIIIFVIVIIKQVANQEHWMALDRAISCCRKLQGTVRC